MVILDTHVLHWWSARTMTMQIRGDANACNPDGEARAVIDEGGREYSDY